MIIWQCRETPDAWQAATRSQLAEFDTADVLLRRILICLRELSGAFEDLFCLSTVELCATCFCEPRELGDVQIGPAQPGRLALVHSDDQGERPRRLRRIGARAGRFRSGLPAGAYSSGVQQQSRSVNWPYLARDRLRL